MHVIFSVDERYQSNAIAGSMAHNWLLTMGAKPLLGAYTMRDTGRVVMERSYLLSEKLFEDAVRNSPLVQEQESFLFVTECNKQYATLHFADGLTYKDLGCLKAVSQAEAIKADDWSYDPFFNRYFITVPNSQSEAPAERDARELWDAIEDMLYSQAHGSINSCDNAAAKLRAIRDKQKPKWID